MVKKNLKQLKNITRVDEAAILDKMAEIVTSDPQMQFADATGNLRGTDASTKEKIEHIISLHLMGISVKSILAQINKLSIVKWWSKYSSEAGIRAVIANHFKDYSKPVAGELEEHLEWLKQSMFEQQEHIMEKASIFIADKKKKWTPFEYMAALKELYAMRQQMIENKNWNDSKKNINAGWINITNQLNVFVDNSRKIAFGQVTNPALELLKNKLTERFKIKPLDDNQEE